MDLCAVVRGDHDDIDRGIEAISDPNTPVSELVGMLEVLRLAFACHHVAEKRVLDELWLRPTCPEKALRWLISQVRDDHARHQRLAEQLSRVEPGSPGWFELATKFSLDLVEHSRRHERMRASFNAHIPAEVQKQLIAQYKTERLAVLASTSPLHVAQLRCAY